MVTAFMTLTSMEKQCSPLLWGVVFTNKYSKKRFGKLRYYLEVSYPRLEFRCDGIKVMTLANMEIQ